MAATTRTFWQRWRFRLNGLLLVAPVWFFYDALTPVFPPAWPEQAIGPFTATPTPADGAPPYVHDGALVKDFSVRFCTGCVASIRTGHVSVGPAPVPAPDGYDGVLHGNAISQHVHVPFPAQASAADRLWISVQEWNGQVHSASWPLTQ
jgi:hypothetical protein